MAADPASDAARLAAMVERLETGVAIFDAEGTLRHANGAIRALLGEDVALAADTLADGRLALPGGRAVPASRLALPDGATAILVPRPEGGAAFLRGVLDSVDTSVVAYDAEDRYIRGNAAYHVFYPHLAPEEELVGLTFEQMLRGTLAAGSFQDAQARDDPEAYVARRVTEFRSGNPELSERMTMAGRWDLVRTRVTPSGMRLSIRTRITAVKRAQEELQRANELLEAETAQRAVFVAGLGKELRTPLSAVLGYAEMIENEVLGPLETAKYRECAAHILQSGGHLLDLVVELLERGEAAGRPAMREQAIDLAQLLRREMTLVEPLARDNATQLVLNLPHAPPTLMGDARMVRQILLNLLSNAARFTRRGVVTVSLGRSGDGGIEIAVADTGVGMAPEVVARLGEPFYRGDADARGAVPGTGLGLGVVKELLALHQGSLTVTSAPGRGTRIALQFPPARCVPAG